MVLVAWRRQIRILINSGIAKNTNICVQKSWLEKKVVVHEKMVLSEGKETTLALQKCTHWCVSSLAELSTRLGAGYLMYQPQQLLRQDIPAPAAWLLTVRSTTGFLQQESQQLCQSDWCSASRKGRVTRNPRPSLITLTTWFLVAEQTVTHSLPRAVGLLGWQLLWSKRCAAGSPALDLHLQSRSGCSSGCCTQTWGCLQANDQMSSQALPPRWSAEVLLQQKEKRLIQIFLHFFTGLQD